MEYGGNRLVDADVREWGALGSGSQGKGGRGMMNVQVVVANKRSPKVASLVKRQEREMRSKEGEQPSKFGVGTSHPLYWSSGSCYFGLPDTGLHRSMQLTGLGRGKMETRKGLLLVQVQ